ncbi:MAG TPA: tRNA pseudouridine(55) synthase TruB [Tepidisphaeraceae bacterium]|jgi:tRNA pseudouridine55 synthase
MSLCGVINLDKPAGLSSARLVDRVKRLLPRGTKIGHAGTLDPFATGVLLLLIGKATKSCEQLMAQPKGYEAVVKLGARTATDDPESAEEPVVVPVVPDEQQVRAAANRFIGAIPQRPPAFSAMKVDGQRAYKLARQGQEVEIKPRIVTVHALDVLEYAWPTLRIRVECGRGTYIRAIARDLGEALGTGGYLTQLRRTFVGPFRVENGVTLETLQGEGVERYLNAV